ncbi:MAG: hypothetical protein LBS86_00945 [Treponema sp.]|nr:hypothetical protein [Treponema sp.]
MDKGEKYGGYEDTGGGGGDKTSTLPIDISLSGFPQSKPDVCSAIPKNFGVVFDEASYS